jgi:hypothetical protein
MVFNGIKKVVRKDKAFIDFIISEIEKYEKEIPELSGVPRESSFEMLRQLLAALETISNSEQKKAIAEIGQFLTKVELETKKTF